MRASLVVIAVLLAAVTSRAAEVTRAPELVSSVPPILPDDMPKDWRGGSVGLSLTLDDQGLIMRVDVVTSLGPQADWAALGAATQFVFSPAEIDGKPAPVVIGYTLVFEPRARVTTVEAPPTTESAAADPAKTFTLTGRVRRAGSVEPLPFAEVSISLLLPGGMTGPSSTTNTDADGRFALPPTVEGPYRLEVGTESYEPLLDEQYFDAGKRHDLDIALKPRLANAFETVVQRQRGEPPVSRVTLSRDEVRAIPGTYGDALRVIESLPGVARAPLLGGALMVRGGYPADTAIHFEGVPIPVLYHFGGFTSVVNSAFIENITFMPGGFPVRYGNATAGIVDVQARALDEKTFVTHVDVDLFDFGFFFGGHVTPKLGDVLDLPELRVGFAGRRSHAEIPANLVLSGAQAFGAALPFLPVPLYYDYQLKVESDVTSSSTLSLFLFGAEDSWAIIGEPPPLGTDANGDPLDFADVLNTFLGNRFHRLLGSWELKPLPGVTNTLRPYIGLTRRGLLSDGIAVPLLTGTSLDSPTEETNWGLRDELTVRMTPWLRGLVGFEHHGAAYSAELLAGADFLNVDAPSGVSTRANASLSTAAVYGELQLGPMAGLSATPGVRAELSSLTFEDADGLTPYNGKSKSVVDGWTIDPRVTLRYVVTPALALKGSAGTFHQRPRSQSAALDGDGDVLSPPAALQVIGGFEAKLTDDVSLDAQVYGVNRLSLTRDRSRFYDPARGPFSQPISGVGSYDSYGAGHTLGLELLLRSAPSKVFFGWVSYTFSRTEVSLGSSREQYVAFPFDQTHNLVAVGRLNLPWEVTVGGRFSFVTGNPGPIPDSVSTRHDLDQGSYTPVLSSLQPSRLAPFHRLDLRVDKRFISNWFSVVAFLEVINVYNWPNPEVVFPGGDYRARELRTLLPGPPLLPLLGAELDL